MWFLRYQRYFVFVGFSVLALLMLVQAGGQAKERLANLSSAQKQETRQLEEWFDAYQKLSGANAAFERMYPIEIDSVEGVLDLYRATGIGDMGVKVPIDRLSIRSISSSEAQKSIGVVDVCLDNDQNGLLLSEQSSAFDQLIDVVAKIELDPALSFKSIEVSAKDNRLFAKLNDFCITTRAE